MRTMKLALTVTALAGVAGVAILSTSSVALVSPAKVAVDKAGNIYISDAHDSTIDKLTPDGKLTIIAGEPAKPGFAIGKGSHARFADPSGIAVGPDGSLVVADEVNNVIYNVTAEGVVSILAGDRWSPTASDARARFENPKVSAKEPGDGAEHQPRFNAPLGVAVDQFGNTYVADSNNNIIRKITRNGQVTTVAGTPGAGGYEDGGGKTAKFSAPVGVAVDAAGNIYVADAGNKTIRKIAPDGFVSTLAGKAGKVGYADGKGDAARFHALRDIAIDPAGNLYVVDSGNYNVRKITPGGEVLTVAGEHSNRSLGLNLPTGIAVDHAGNLYVADFTLARITRISHLGGIAVLAGSSENRR